MTGHSMVSGVLGSAVLPGPRHSSLTAPICRDMEVGSLSPALGHTLSVRGLLTRSPHPLRCSSKLVSSRDRAIVRMSSSFLLYALIDLVEHRGGTQHLRKLLE